MPTIYFSTLGMYESLKYTSGNKLEETEEIPCLWAFVLSVFGIWIFLIFYTVWSNAFISALQWVHRTLSSSEALMKRTLKLIFNKIAKKPFFL